MFRLRCKLLAVLTLSVAAAAQKPYLLQDLNVVPRGNRGSQATDFAVLGTKAFFHADAGQGSGLYVHDLGTSQTVALGAGTLTDTYELAVLGAQVFFFATYQSREYLCTSDGTPAGTRTVAPATPYRIRTALTTAGNRLYFVGTDSTSGHELHVWDGSSVKLLRDILPGSGSSDPRELTASGSSLFFSAEDGQNGRELWYTDGTTSGTQLLDIWKGAGGSFPSRLSARFDAKLNRHTLVFSAQASSSEGTEPWTSDGTAKGTTLLKDIFAGGPSSDPGQFTYDAVTNTYLFRASDSAHGDSLWRTDPIAKVTTFVTDIRPDPYSSGLTVIGVHGSQVFLAADDGTHGRELWIWDGQKASMVHDLVPGAADGVGDWAVLTSSAGKPRLFFNGPSQGQGVGLWTSDGTRTGTVSLAWVRPDNPAGRVPASGSILLTADDVIHGSEPWISDGTVAGTKMLFDVNTSAKTSLSGPTESSNPHDGISRFDSVWFVARTNQGVDSPYAFRQGKAYPAGGPWGRGARDLIQLDGWNGGPTVWTALDTSGNRRVAVRTVSGSSFFLSTATNAANLTAVGARLFFTAADPTHGEELWTSLGTPETTHLVRDLKAGTKSSSPNELVAFRGKVYFFAANRLWSSDGTAAGTVTVKAGAGPGPMVAASGYLYFRGQETSTGRELWKTDGTAAGTTLVKDIYPGAAYSNPQPLAAIGDTLLLLAIDAAHGRELWKTDGTEAGTTLVKDIYPGSYGTTIHDFTVAGHRAFFSGRGPGNDELWVTDGTTTGTYRLKDIYLGGKSSDPGPFVVTGKKDIWFPATTAEHGRELWHTDGTEAGTTLVCDLVPGPWSSNPEVLGICDEHSPGLLLAATHWEKGRELFHLPLPDVTRPIGQGCAHDAQPPTLRVDVTANSLFLVGKLGGRDVRPKGFVFLLVSERPSSPLFLGCSIYVGLSFMVLGPFQETNGAWETPLLVNANLLGAKMSWQSIVWPAPGPLGFDVSNGVITTFPSQ